MSTIYDQEDHARLRANRAETCFTRAGRGSVVSHLGDGAHRRTSLIVGWSGSRPQDLPEVLEQLAAEMREQLNREGL